MCVDVCLSRHCSTEIADTASSIRRMSDFNTRTCFSFAFFVALHIYNLTRPRIHLRFRTQLLSPQCRAVNNCQYPVTLAVHLIISCGMSFSMMLNCIRVCSISLMSEATSLSLACAREFQHTFDVQATRYKNDLNTSC